MGAHKVVGLIQKNLFMEVIFIKKYLIKKLFAVLYITALLLAFNVGVFAYDSTGFEDAPATTAGSFTSAGWDRLWQERETAEGQYCYADFQNYGTLQSDFVADDDREVIVYLMEADDWPSDDDHAKTYKGSFYGRSLYVISYDSTIQSGVIDLNGDNGVELYIKFLIDKMEGDPATPLIASGFFEYDRYVY